MRLTYQQALRLKYDYSDLLKKAFKPKVTDIIIVPAEKEFFIDFMECYYVKKDDLGCLKQFNTNRFNILVVFGELIPSSLKPYEFFLDFVEKHMIEFDLQSYTSK